MLGRARIDLAAAMAGIDKGVGADAGDGAGFAGSDVAEQVADDALRQVVSLNLVVDGKLLQLWGGPSARRSPARQALCGRDD
jgi:hypothetical protein